MNKLMLSVVAALAVSAVPAFAADMPVKAMKAPAAAPSPWDIAFGVDFTTDYRLRGVSQSDRKPAEQGYFELDYTANDWLKLYAGLWGSSLAPYAAEAEIDISGGARLSFGNFGLDLGYVYYYYPDGAVVGVTGYSSFGDFYAKPSYKITDWLTIGGTIDGGNNNNGGFTVVGSKSEGYYSGNAVITLPFAPAGIAISLNPEVGRQWAKCTTFGGTPCVSFTYYDVGLDFVYKSVTLDLRYWNTNAPSAAITAPAAFGGNNLAGSTFVATLKFDTTLSALK